MDYKIFDWRMWLFCVHILYALGNSGGSFMWWTVETFSNGGTFQHNLIPVLPGSCSTPCSLLERVVWLCLLRSSITATMKLLSSSSSLCSTPLSPPSTHPQALFDSLLVREVTLCLALYLLRSSITATMKLLSSSLSLCSTPPAPTLYPPASSCLTGY